MYDPNEVVWYSRSRGSADAGPSVGINKSGRVVLNQDALALFGERPEAFQVGVIQGQRGKVTLVLQAAQKGDAGSLSLTPQGSTKFSLNTIRFLKERGLEKLFGAATSKPEHDAQNNALVVAF